MSQISLIGAFVITLALLAYGIGCIAIQRFKMVTSGVLIFITLGVFLDLVAVIFMIVGSAKGIFTPHVILGYSAMLTMIVHLLLIWKIYIKTGIDSIINKPVILYSKIAYSWWVIAYITGSILVIWQKI